MLERRAILVALFLAAQAVLAHWTVSFERPPAAPDLARLPAELGEWRQLGENRLAGDVLTALHADRLLSRTYVQRPSGTVADLFVAWYRSQRGGTTQPHPPTVCLPASGWTPETTGEITLATPAGSIPVSQYEVRKGSERAVVLYWYQMPRRAVAGEWAAKFWLGVEAFEDRRTDTALVRVVTWPRGGWDDAQEAARSFVRDLYPALREVLPATVR
jgi:EpsI family protein